MLKFDYINSETYIDQSKAMIRLPTIKQKKFKYNYANGNVI